MSVEPSLNLFILILNFFKISKKVKKDDLGGQCSCRKDEIRPTMEVSSSKANAHNEHYKEYEAKLEQKNATQTRSSSHEG